MGLKSSVAGLGRRAHMTLSGRNQDRQNHGAEDACETLHKTFPRKRQAQLRRGLHVLIRRVEGLDWRPGRVYFLTLLEPLAGTTGR
jgi:transposase